MPQKALYELAEATLGLAPEMQWSVDETIARRETQRLFQRVYNGDTTPEAALEAFVLVLTARLQHCVSVIEQRYEDMLLKLTPEQQARCPALNEFFEFFTGVHKDALYSLNEDITRRELEPLFTACCAGRLTSKDCQDAVFDYVIAKRDVTLITLQESVKRLKVQIDGVVPDRVKEEADDPRKAP